MRSSEEEKSREIGLRAERNVLDLLDAVAFGEKTERGAQKSREGNLRDRT
jgi:hypothetical protein